MYRLQMGYLDRDPMNDMRIIVQDMDRTFATEDEAEEMVKQLINYMGIEGATISRLVNVRGENYQRWEPISRWGKKRPRNTLVQW